METHSKIDVGQLSSSTCRRRLTIRLEAAKLELRDVLEQLPMHQTNFLQKGNAYHGRCELPSYYLAGSRSHNH
jgi:hypothetical protein